MSLGTQIIWLFVLAIPIASVAWTVTHEEIFREFHDSCEGRVRKARNVFERKFFYLFTCEYCFSHYVTIFFLALTGYKLLYLDFRGYVIAFFALPFVANAYIGIYGQLKLGAAPGRTEIKSVQKDVELKEIEKEERAETTINKPAA
jgi:hypothetical protein